MIKIDATLAVSYISHFQLRPLDLPMVGHLRHPLEEQRFLRQPQDYRLRNWEHSGALGALISLIFEIPIKLWQQVHATQSQGQDHESCGDATPQSSLVLTWKKFDWDAETQTLSTQQPCLGFQRLPAVCRLEPCERRKWKSVDRMSKFQNWWIQSRSRGILEELQILKLVLYQAGTDFNASAFHALTLQTLQSNDGPRKAFPELYQFPHGSWVITCWTFHPSASNEDSQALAPANNAPLVPSRIPSPSAGSQSLGTQKIQAMEIKSANISKGSMHRKIWKHPRNSGIFGKVNSHWNVFPSQLQTLQLQPRWPPSQLQSWFFGTARQVPGFLLIWYTPEILTCSDWQQSHP